MSVPDPSTTQWVPLAGVGLPSSMVKIADTTLASPAAQIDFTGIPQTYAHLLLVLRARTDQATTISVVNIRFNSDAGSNYNSQQLYAAGATAAGLEGLVATSGIAGGAAGASAVGGAASATIILIPSYAQAAFSHHWVSLGFSLSAASTGNLSIRVPGGMWSNVGPVNRVTLLPSGGSNFVAGSRATIFGIG